MTAALRKPPSTLRHADALRRRGLADQDEAMRIYVAKAGAIDPRTAAGADRVRWILQRAAPFDPALEPLLRRAARTLRNRPIRDAVEIALWQFPFRRGDLAAAEAHLLPLHRRHRGTGTLPEIGVSNNLAGLCIESGREFEALVLARRAARVSEAIDYAFGHAVALSQKARVLSHLEDWDELRRVADRLEFLIPQLDEWHHHYARRAVHTARMEANLGQGDVAGARREYRSVRAQGLPSRLGDDADGTRLEIRIALAQGRPADAIPVAAELAASRTPDSRSWLYATALLGRCLVEAGRRREALRAAEPVLAMIRGRRTRRFGAAELLHVTVPLCSALADDAESTELCEAASQLLLERIAEIHACYDEIVGLPGAAEEDRPYLARFRFRFLAQHAELLTRIAAMHDRPGAAPPAALSALAEDGRLRVCAWCLSLRRPDGSLLPIGHLLPDIAGLGVTHGICDPCRRLVGV